LDLSLSELTRTLSAVPSGIFEHVRCHGLLGTYDDGLEWLKLPENSAKSTCIMWLGSSIGNLNCEESASFLRRFTSALGPEDSMLIAIDGCLEKDKVYHAYNDQFGKTHEFIRNGLVHANALLGKDVFLQADWDVVGEYDEEAERHQAFYVARKNLHIDGIDFLAGEKVRVEESYKYSSIQRERLWEKAGLTEGAVWGDKTGTYRKYLIFHIFHSLYMHCYLKGPFKMHVSHHPMSWPYAFTRLGLRGSTF
jgi:EasF-like predicted methyltransferase